MSLDVCLPAFLPSSSSSFSFILILLRFGVLVFAIDSKANGNGLEVLGVAPSSYGIKWVSGDRDLKRLTWAVSRLSWNGKPGIRPLRPVLPLFYSNTGFQPFLTPMFMPSTFPHSAPAPRW